MRKLLLLLAFSLFSTVAVSSAALAQMRQLPPLSNTVKRGITGEPRQMPFVVIGKETLRLAAGGIIFTADNRTIVHQSLPQNVDVLYQLEMGGAIRRIYILTPLERERLDQARK